MVDGAGAEAPARISDLAAGGSAFLQLVQAPASGPEQVPAAAAPRTVSFAQSFLFTTATLCLSSLNSRVGAISRYSILPLSLFMDIP